MNLLRDSHGRVAFRPQDSRSANLGLVATALYERPGLSRADLARFTGLSRVTISELVAELLDVGVVVETGAVEKGKPGKRGTRLEVAYDQRCIIAIDMSGSRSVTGTLSTLDGVLSQRLERRLIDERGEAALKILVETVDELAALATKPVVGVGVGTPGLVGPEPGVVTSTNLQWHRFDLGAALTERTGLPVDVGNDANLAALAERRFGGAPNDFIRMQISRGVGAGLLLGGQLVLGPHGGAGEIGHVVVDPAGGLCSCGKLGCLETWVSVPALEKRLATADDRAAILAQAGQKLGQALSFVVGMSDITDIVLGGPARLLDGPFQEAAIATLNASTQIEAKPPAKLTLSTLGQDAVLLGAAAQVLSSQFSIF